MIRITLLTPTWTEAQTCKLFSLENGKPKLEKPYNLGKFFRYKELQVDGLVGWFKLLSRCANAPVIRIAGRPSTGLPDTVQRLKENFFSGGTNLLLIDADDWPVPQGFSLRTKENIYATVKEILVNRMGLNPLKDAACCVLLSNSFWYWSRIRAHIYFELSEPIDLDLLHTWGYAYNEASPEYKIDPTLFRQVQPDFISKRQCIGFADPLPDTLRLTLHCDNLAPTVNKAVLADLQKTIDQSKLYQPVSTTGVVNSSGAKLGVTWEETLKLCGSAQHGINEPAFRACAQMVQALGNQVVKDNLNYYVDKVFALTWQAIQSYGVRGNKKDRDYYDRARFRNYLTTSLQKQFGESSDSKVSEVAAVLKKVIEGGNPALLFDRDMLENYRYIRSKDPGKWATIKNIVKTKLKGKVTTADLEKALVSVNKTDVGAMMDQVINSFQWIEGAIDLGLYCKKKTACGYNLIDIGSGVENDLYHKSIELFSDATPMQFERNIMKVLVAKSRDPLTTLFSRVVVENRCYSEIKGKKTTTYFNVGVNAAGKLTTCVVNEDGISMIPSSDSPVIWSTDRQIMPCEILEETNVTEKRRDALIKNYILGMRNLLTVEDADALIDVISWQVTSVINSGTALLLEFTGGSDCGKSTSALFAKELIDPTSSDIKEAPDLHNGLYKKEDLAKILRARHVTIIDNLSNLSPTQQDLLCSIATGWKFDLRVMYTQQFVKLVIKKPIILTSLSPVITNQDLRSRSISVAVSGKKKRMYGDVFEYWNKNKAEMRTGLLYLVSKVIKYVNELRTGRGNTNGRDLWGEAARFVVMKHINFKHGSDTLIKKHIASRKRERDISEALVSAGSAQIIAWICKDGKTFNTKKFTSSASALYLQFRKFINENAGEVVHIHGIAVEISTQKTSSSPRSFGMMLSRLRADIAATAGWDVERRSVNGIAKWIFSRID